MRKIIKKHILAIFGILFLALIGCASNVSAREIYINATPTKFEYELNPGDTKTGSFRVSNEGDMEWAYSVEATPYDARSDEKGELNVTYDTKSTYSQITNWVKFDKNSGLLKPKEEIEIKFTITVPKDAPGGGQYAALLVSASHPDSEEKENTKIGEVASIGPVLFTKVNGVIREEGDIISLDAKTIMNSPPISMESVVENRGNVHALARHVMKVFPLFGGESIFNNEEDPKEITVFPESKRYYSMTWTAEEGAPSIGIFRLEGEVSIYNEKKTISKIIIVCPFWVILSVLLFIIALVYWIASRAASRREQKKKGGDTTVELPGDE